MRLFLEGCSVMFRSGTQKFVCQSVTETKLNAGVICAQDMSYVMQVIQSLELKNKIASVVRDVDLANNWSVSGHTRHIDEQYFL